MSDQLKRVQRLAGEAPTSPPTLASEPDILAVFRRDMRLCGLVGEEKAAQLIYLAITSRLLPKPVSIAVKGHSASGKSYTVGRVVDFFPRDAVVEFTGMSEKALVYRAEDYQHRTLIVYEVTGLREGNEDDLTSYFIRSLLSEGRIDYEVTVKKEGEFTTQRITKEGPTNLVFTTTKTQVHGENETRVLSLNTDDGTDQTRRVLAALADETENTVDKDQWRDLQAWLQGAEHRVTIPYSRQLAKDVPPLALAVRLRRDFEAVLGLIRSHAILHQQTRQRDHQGRIVAALEDYAAIRDLVADVVSEGIGVTVSDTVRETVRAVEALSEGGKTVSRVEVQRYLKIDQSNASRRLRRAADGGYIRNLEDKRGRPGRWEIGDSLPEAVPVLPDPERLYTPSRTNAYPHSPAGNGLDATHTAYSDASESNAASGVCAYAHGQEGEEATNGRRATDPNRADAYVCPRCVSLGRRTCLNADDCSWAGSDQGGQTERERDKRPCAASPPGDN